MENNYLHEQKYILAKKRVEKIKGFYTHIIVTLIIIPVLVYINLTFNPEYHWFYFPMVGMLIGVLFHWFGVFGVDKIGLGKEWEQRKINEIMKENENN